MTAQDIEYAKQRLDQLHQEAERLFTRKLVAADAYSAKIDEIIRQEAHVDELERGAAR